MEKTSPDQPIYAGINTFMRAPYIPRIADLKGYDIGVLGIPLDYGASYREGAKHAPRSLRAHSHWEDLDGGEFFDSDTDQIVTAQDLTIADVGDVLVYPTDAKRTNEEIIRAVSELRKRAFPLILGGDHSVTYAAFKGCLAGLPENEKPMGLLHFDAHLDVEKSYGVMPEVWHGNPFRTLIDEGSLDPLNMVTIGPRGLIARKWIDYIREKQIRLFTVPEVRRKSIETVIQEAISRLQERCKSVYLTFDIDCIDPAQAPGTGTPWVGGLKAEEVIPVMRKLSPLPIKAFDMVEVNPPLDTAGRTAILASDIMWNFLSFSLNKKRV
jgi:agmatinase